jgi:hypothetical protein
MGTFCADIGQRDTAKLDEFQGAVNIFALLDAELGRLVVLAQRFVADNLQQLNQAHAVAKVCGRQSDCSHGAHRRQCFRQAASF